MVQSSTDLIEKTLIGCIYTKPKLIDEVFIKEEYFNNTYSRLVFKISLEFYKKYQNLDIILIYQEYESYLTSNFIEFINDCVSFITTTTIFNEYQEKLFEIYKNKLIVKYVDKFTKKEITQENLFEYLEKIKNMVSDNRFEYLSEEEISNIIYKSNVQIKLKYETLNNLLDLKEQDFIVIGARTGVGKTGFALNLLEDISSNYKCLYFNMEMSEQQILKRLVSITSRVPINRLTNPETEYQSNLVKEGIKTISQKKIKIITGIQSTNSIKQTVIRESKEEHIVVFIDYVGLMAGYGNKSLYEATTKIVKELRQISLRFDCTIICLAQINRNGDDSNGPQLKDLKDSGELEQSAVSVLLLHRRNKNAERIEETEVTIAKNRNGRTGTLIFEYDKFNQKFEERRKFK